MSEDRSPHDDLPPLVQQMRDADSNQARARLLLQMSDTMRFAYGAALANECRSAGFDDGVLFIDVMRAVANAVRNDHGELPENAARAAEGVTYALCAVAHGYPAEVPVGQWRG